MKLIMILEEAIMKLLDFETYFDVKENGGEEVINTILNYIQNESIPKEKVKNKIEEIRGVEWQPGKRTAGKSVKYWKLVGKEEALQELLGEWLYEPR